MNGEMLSKMISLATERHAGQFDKGGRPYILHPLTVMHRLRTDDEELQCIAVGHDLLEDTTVTVSELRLLGFSQRVRITSSNLRQILQPLVGRNPKKAFAVVSRPANSIRTAITKPLQGGGKCRLYLAT